MCTVKHIAHINPFVLNPLLALAPGTKNLQLCVAILGIVIRNALVSDGKWSKVQTSTAAFVC